MKQEFPCRTRNDAYISRPIEALVSLNVTIISYFIYANNTYLKSNDEEVKEQKNIK
jgi:hypothetical protein